VVWPVRAVLLGRVEQEALAAEVVSFLTTLVSVATTPEMA
jgi:hypothetical protein